MEENQLKEIEERCKKATPGPWIENESSTYIYLRTRDGESYICSALDKDNAKFIAHSREDIPRLLAHIKYLEAELFHFREMYHTTPKTGQNKDRSLRNG